MKKLLLLCAVCLSDIFVEGNTKFNADKLHDLIGSNVDLNKPGQEKLLKKYLNKLHLFKTIDVRFENNNYYLTLEDGYFIKKIYLNYFTLSSKLGNFQQFLLSRPGKYVTKEDIEVDISALEDILMMQGYKNVSLTYKMKKSSFNNDIQLIYNLNIGPNPSLKDIRFFGNKSISNEVILNHLSLNSFMSYFSFSTGLGVESINSIFNDIRSIYNKYGFYDIEVTNISTILSQYEELYNYNIHISEGFRYKNKLQIDSVVDLDANDMKLFNDFQKHIYSTPDFCNQLNVFVKYLEKKYSKYCITLSYNPESSTKIVKINLLIKYADLHLIKDIDILANQKKSDSEVKSDMGLYQGCSYEKKEIDDFINGYFIYNNFLSKLSGVSYSNVNHFLENGRLSIITIPMASFSLNVMGIIDSITSLISISFGNDKGMKDIINKLVLDFKIQNSFIYFNTFISLLNYRYNLTVPIINQYIYFDLMNSNIVYYYDQKNTNAARIYFNIYGKLLLNLREIMPCFSKIYIDLGLEAYNNKVFNLQLSEVDHVQKCSNFLSFLYSIFFDFNSISNGGQGVVKISFIKIPFLFEHTFYRLLDINNKLFITNVHFNILNKDSMCYSMNSILNCILDLELSINCNISFLSGNMFNFINKIKGYYDSNNNPHPYKKSCSNILSPFFGTPLSTNKQIYNEMKTDGKRYSEVIFDTESVYSDEKENFLKSIQGDYYNILDKYYYGLNYIQSYISYYGAIYYHPDSFDIFRMFRFGVFLYTDDIMIYESSIISFGFGFCFKVPIINRLVNIYFVLCTIDNNNPNDKRFSYHEEGFLSRQIRLNT